MANKYIRLNPIKKHNINSCKNCGSEDYLISENGKVKICEQCGLISKEVTTEDETHN